MSERGQNIRGIHYEISKPKRNPYDGYYYQRVRQVDEQGNLVGVGEQLHRSPSPGSADGLVVPSIDLMNIGSAAWHVAKTGRALATRDFRTAAEGGVELARDLRSGLTEGYRTWPGTEKPWEPLLDWRTGDRPVDDLVHGRSSHEMGDGNGIGSWQDASADFRAVPPRYGWEAAAQGLENVSAPDRSPAATSPAWNNVYVRDSAAAAGIPSRNNVFEHGFPEAGSVQPPLMAPGATRGVGSTGASVAPPVPFLPAAPRAAPAGLPGLMIEAGVTDPLNPDAPLPGGIAGLIREYLRSNFGGRN